MEGPIRDFFNLLGEFLLTILFVSFVLGSIKNETLRITLAVIVAILGLPLLLAVAFFYWAAYGTLALIAAMLAALCIGAVLIHFGKKVWTVNANQSEPCVKPK